MWPTHNPVYSLIVPKERTIVYGLEQVVEHQTLYPNLNAKAWAL